MPSIQEAFGLMAVEAMACGTPVITSNTSSMAEVAGNAALTVDPLNVRQLSEAMVALAEDEVAPVGYRRVRVEQYLQVVCIADGACVGEYPGVEALAGFGSEASDDADHLAHGGHRRQS